MILLEKYSSNIYHELSWRYLYLTYQSHVENPLLWKFYFYSIFLFSEL